MARPLSLPNEPSRVPWKHRKSGICSFTAHKRIILEFVPRDAPEAAWVESGADVAKPYSVTWREDREGHCKRFRELRPALRFYHVTAARLSLPHADAPPFSLESL